jgi:hypothetical protein
VASLQDEINEENYQQLHDEPPRSADCGLFLFLRGPPANSRCRKRSMSRNSSHRHAPRALFLPKPAYRGELKREGQCRFQTTHQGVQKISLFGPTSGIPAGNFLKIICTGIHIHPKTGLSFLANFCTYSSNSHSWPSKPLMPLEAASKADPGVTAAGARWGNEPVPPSLTQFCGLVSNSWYPRGAKSHKKNGTEPSRLGPEPHCRSRFSPRRWLPISPGLGSRLLSYNPGS